MRGWVNFVEFTTAGSRRTVERVLMLQEVAVLADFQDRLKIITVAHIQIKPNTKHNTKKNFSDCNYSKIPSTNYRTV